MALHNNNLRSFITFAAKTMDDSNDIRIDKYLWAVRVYKTRSIATDEINKGRVLIDNVSVKASRKVKAGETIIVRKPPILHTFRVKALLEKRVSASLVPQYLEDLTPAQELEKREMARIGMNFIRERGTGRPTKKDRREIDRLQNTDDDYFFDE
jgi:ribosome-associated heat shock protein Hsp15